MKEETSMKNSKINKLLLVAIATPIVVALFIGGGAAIMTGIAKIAEVLFPNIWVALGYAYSALIFFLIGAKTGNKKKKKS